MSATASSAPATSSPGAAFSTVMSAALGVAAAKVDDWTEKLNQVASGSASKPVDRVADDLAEGGGAKQQAGVRGVQAGVTGKNPVWAAIKGAWAGGGTGVKVAVIAAGVALVLVLLLSPVLLVVVLLAVPIVWVISKARSSGS